MSPSSEDLLRARMREVDDLDPPAGDDFEFRALRAGRERLRKRQTWTRGLIGGAAAVVIGVVAVPNLHRVEIGTGGGASSASGVAAPEQAPSAVSGESGPGLSAPDDKSSQPPGAAGSDAVDPAGPSITANVARLSSELSQTYPQTFTALVPEGSPKVTRIVLHMTEATPAAQRLVRDTFPSDREVVFLQSAYSVQGCDTMLTRVTGDRALLTGNGYALGSLRCNADGRVVLPVQNLVTAEQLQMLAERYGDSVAVVQEASAPSSPTP
jgi:hypothetical protein